MATGHEAKRRRLSPSKIGGSKPSASNGISLNDFYSRAAEWDLEQAYECQRRKTNKKDKERTRLPIKTEEGRLEHIEEAEMTDGESENPLGSEVEHEEIGSLEIGINIGKRPPTPQKVQIREAKEELA